MSKYQIKVRNNFVEIWQAEQKVAYWPIRQENAFEEAQKLLRKLENLEQKRDERGRFVKQESDKVRPHAGLPTTPGNSEAPMPSDLGEGKEK